MKQLNKSCNIETYKTEILEMQYDNQEEFNSHSEELHNQGWERDLYSHEYDFSTGKHDYVFYSKSQKIEFENINFESLDSAILYYKEQLKAAMLVEESYNLVSYYSQMLVWLEELKELKEFKSRVIRALS